MTGAERIADFALSLRMEDVPDDVQRAARLHLLDAIGVGLAASAGADQRMWHMAAQAPGEAILLGGGTAAPTDAAMLNGALIHSLEYDDTHIASVVHGSAVAAPVALAAARTGADLLTAYLIAWEVSIALGLAAPGAFQAHGAQVTSVAGAIGAAAAAGRVHGLDRRTLVSAVAIAGSQASGLLAFLDDGSSVKALNPGWAAQTGLRAAALAGAGMTGPSTILESRFGPFTVFGAETAGLERSLATLGRKWHLPEAAFKLYPCCHYIHPFLELTEGLMADGLTVDDLDSLTAHVAAPQAPLIAEPWTRRQAPASGYDGKWGLAYCIALMLTDGRVDVAGFETAPREAVVALARRMAWEPDDDSGFPVRFPARIEVVTTAGQRHDVAVETVMGAPERPVPESAVRDKFRRNAIRVLPETRAEALRAAILDGDVPDLDALTGALTG